VDAVVEGVHFRRAWSSPAQIAARAVGAALSDLAAMAADPGEIYVTLGLPAGTAPGFCEELADGFVAASRRYGAVLAGGDTVASPVLFASVTVVGRAAEGEGFIQRSGARPGDLVAVTGSFGGAAAGLMVLEGEAAANDSGSLDPAIVQALITRQIAPQPRLAEGSALRGSGVTALIDVSDGLVADLGHIARSSGVAIRIDGDLVPMQPGVAAVARSCGRRPSELALSGGEDYELAMALPPEHLATVRNAVEGKGCDFTVIGEVVSGSGVEVSGADPEAGSLPGFDHFR
jgi:thiamine-monophosphate kinase